MKKIILLSLLLASSVCQIFAFGKKDVTEESVGPESSWQETFDINSKKDGKYNIVVTAEDKAGNIGTAGPFNVYIDTESDLPVTQIVNPVSDMKIPGNLNIVGTCTDDDKVSEVYLILDGDEANPIKVSGTDYWSYYLDTTNMAEGPHTIEAFGIDDGNPDAYKTESGAVDQSRVVPKTGHRIKVNWELNRRSPVIEVGNMAMGALVSGKITLTGTLRDGNGIKSFFYSTDGGNTYLPLKFKKTEVKEALPTGENFYYTFSLGIDTTKFKDGPTLCMFKSYDNLSTEGNYSFLYYIDNTKPDVKIVSPATGESANGVFTIAGYAKDTIGLKSLSWKFAGESGDFVLTPGNPYFAKTVDSRSMSTSADFIVTAVDTSGNTVELVTKIPLDQEADKPVVTILSPSRGYYC